MDAGQDQVCQDGLLLLPPGLAVVPRVAMDRFAVRQLALHHVVPAAALAIHAVLRHQLGDLGRHRTVALVGVEGADARQVPGDLQIVADDGPVLLPAPAPVRAPILVESLLHEDAVLVILEVLNDRVGTVGQHVGVLFRRGRQIQIDQIRRRMIADRIPILAGPVERQHLGTRIEPDRVDMAEIAPELWVVIKPREQRLGTASIGEDPRIAGDAVGLHRPGERVDLLISRYRIQIVAEAGRQDLALLCPLHIDGMVPIANVVGGIGGAEVLAKIVGAGFRRFEVALVAGH